MPSRPLRDLAILSAVSAILLLAPGTPRAQSDRAGDDCGDKPSTQETVECLDRLTAQWDKKLNANYQLALKRADPAGIAPLRASERAWLEYRKQRCYYRGTGEGTITRILGADCFMGMTRARAEELGEDAKGLGN